MKHATPVTIEALAPLRRQLAAIPGVTERRPGSFARGSRAFLHFHEDPAGLFADLRGPQDWERLPANTAAERRAIVRRARELAAAR